MASHMRSTTTRAAGIERGVLEGWAHEAGWETLLNRAGTTFRKLPDKDKEGITDKKAIALMLAQPSLIKRPVLDVGGKLLVGFKPEQYEERSRCNQIGRGTQRLLTASASGV